MLAGLDGQIALLNNLLERHRTELAALRHERDDLTARLAVHPRPHQRHAIAPHMVWDRQPAFVEAKTRHGDVPGIPDIRCAFLQSCLASLDRLPGDVAECGVRHGKSALFLLTALRVRRQVLLFDSFEGLSDPLPAKDGLDSAFAQGGSERLFHNPDLASTLARFAPYGDRVEVFQGWIPERFAEVADRRFCFVHLDVDLYQPTRDGLEFFYDRLVPGGMLVCDDYGTSLYPGARIAMDDFFASRSETPVELPQGQGFIVKVGEGAPP